MTTKDFKTIALSKNTAELLEAKKKLDECYDTLAKVHEDIIGYESGFEDKPMFKLEVQFVKSVNFTFE